MYQGVSTNMREALDWKHSRISVLKVESVYVQLRWCSLLSFYYKCVCSTVPTEKEPTTVAITFYDHLRIVKLVMLTGLNIARGNSWYGTPKSMQVNSGMSVLI
jgi:hypothetical protein